MTEQRSSHFGCYLPARLGNFPARRPPSPERAPEIETAYALAPEPEAALCLPDEGILVTGNPPSRSLPRTRYSECEYGTSKLDTPRRDPEQPAWRRILVQCKMTWQKRDVFHVRYRDRDDTDR